MQNIGGRNTMLFSPAARSLLAANRERHTHGL